MKWNIIMILQLQLKNKAPINGKINIYQSYLFVKYLRDIFLC